MIVSARFGFGVAAEVSGCAVDEEVDEGCAVESPPDGFPAVFLCPFEVGEAEQGSEGHCQDSHLFVWECDDGDAVEQEQDDDGFDAFAVHSVPVQNGIHDLWAPFFVLRFGSVARLLCLSTPFFGLLGVLLCVSQLG